MSDRPAVAPLWMGVDVGTQSVRVVVVDDRGSALAFGSEPLHSRRMPDRLHEQDADRWWHAVGRAARRARGQLGPADARLPVGAVAICSTSGTVLLTDHDGAVASPALMYDDARAVDEVETIRRRSVGRTPPDTRPAPDVQLSWALPKIAWLLRHATPEVRRRARVTHSADFVAAQLVGHAVATDASHALKSGYDVLAGRWDQRLIDAAGADPRALPEVVVPGTELGRVSAEAAEHTAIPAGTPVVAGMTDGCAAQIAAGALAPGSWNSVLGTTLILKGVSEALIEDPDGAVYSHRHPDAGWLPGGASNVGAGILSRDFPGADLDALGRAARAFEPAGGVIYPLTARGERFPFVRPDATGFELGTFTGPAEHYAAILQGVAFVERLCYEHLAGLGADVTGPVSITGGAVRSEYWSQVRADVLDRPLRLPTIPEPSFGMAVLASARTESVTARAAGMVTVTRTIEPRPGHRDRFGDAYDQLIAELTTRGYIRALEPDTAWGV
ncbi:MAG TPA: FGGY family carbohydrate kinase [Jiangellaceae bacterium]